MEELFARQDVDPVQIDSFLNALLKLAESERIWLLFTLRSDFTEHLLKERRLRELLGEEGLYHLNFPDYADLNQIIRQPAFAAGLTYEKDNETGLSLDDIILKEAAEAPDTLPLAAILPV